MLLCIAMFESFRGLRKFSGGYSIQKRLTPESQRARSKEFLIKKYSDLCELCVSAVKEGLTAFGCGLAALGSFRLNDLTP
jgi:hypothetical protein